ncbi:hypothetical protein GC197_04930 [bacterium]|nr:hypothetical protein [bacterium]
MSEPDTHPPTHDEQHLHNDEELHATYGNTKYYVVFVALCLLTLCSFLTYFQWWDTHIPSNVSMAFMMAVSCAKALLVMLFFMHLLWEANWKWILTVPASMMSVFLLCMLIPDIGYRAEHYSNARWLHAPVPNEEAVEAATVEAATAPASH